jgi:hypothetical protein
MELLLLYTRLVDRVQFTAGEAFFLRLAAAVSVQARECPVIFDRAQ